LRLSVVVVFSASSLAAQRELPIPADSLASQQPRETITDAHRKHWAFQQPALSDPPPIPHPDGHASSQIDAFVLQKLQEVGLAPSPSASRHSLLRRATFDLTGLPPTPQELDVFFADDSPDAFAKVIDRLLASPAYGQRWARHWLDVARYADYHDADPGKRNKLCETTEAWRYRDWVVDSFNRDLAFDQFIIHQIAGDLLPSPDGGEVYVDGLVATTFLTNGVWDRGDADKEKIVSDMADDQIDTVGKAFMALTLGCSRCHDHKFDPISQDDYYALAGIFYSSHMLKALGAKGGEYVVNRVPLVPQETVDEHAQKLAALNTTVAKLAELDKKSPPPPADDPGRRALVAQRDRQTAELPAEPPLAMAIAEGGTPGGIFPAIQDVPVHIRGSYTQLGRVVPRRMPEFFAGSAQPPITSGSGRRELARWVASHDNPLTARVIVNRIWQWHFGEGLVRTPNNFGMRSLPPTHPELLDWLAMEFVAEGWSLKKLHRRIMLSATYQQAAHSERQAPSSEPATPHSKDPENRWLGRFSARRLEAEALRDAMLFVAGDLDVAPGGPAGDDLNISRRSLYVQTARWNRSNYATLFDAANPDASTEKRFVSTAAPQALFLLNHEFVIARAERLAARLLREVPDDDVARIQRAYRLLFGRRAAAEEIAVARAVLTDTGQPDKKSAWTDLAHVLFCSNEFVYLD